MNVEMVLCLALIFMIGCGVADPPTRPGHTNGEGEGESQPNDDARSTLTAVWSLDQFAWKNRPVLIFAHSDQHPDIITQRQFFDPVREELAERDIVVVEILRGDVLVAGRRVSAEAESLRQRFDVRDDDGFAVRLIGKDTGVKLRRGAPVTTDELFGLIDAMPMRRQEIRENEN